MDPGAFVHAPVAISKFTLAVSEIVLKGSFVLSIFWIGGSPLTLALVFNPQSIVEVAVGPNIPAPAMLFVLFPLPFVRELPLVGLPGHRASTVAHVVDPSALVGAAILIGEGPLAVLLAVEPLPIIFRVFGSPNQHSLSVVLVIFELPVVCTSIWPGQLTFAGLLVLIPRPCVDGAVRILQGAQSTALVSQKGTFIPGPRDPGEDSLALLLTAVPRAVIDIPVLVFVSALYSCHQ
jgi:hypothetical protein